MIVHHDFEMSSRDFEARRAFPADKHLIGKEWKGDYASQSPLNAFFVTREGGGAEGTAGYLALPGSHSDQFYAEATPFWDRPNRTYDLRNTRVSFYLKAISPIRVAPGYKPYLFIDDHDSDTNTYCGWYIKKPLKVGKEWSLNTIDLTVNEKLWFNYSKFRSLDHVLGHVGFIGVMYLNGAKFTGVDACGVLGIDELKFNIPLK